MSKDRIFLSDKRLEILRLYYKELIDKTSETTGLDFSLFLDYKQPFSSDIIRLEGFIHHNKLFDTKKISEKYKNKIIPQIKRVVF